MLSIPEHDASRPTNIIRGNASPPHALRGASSKSKKLSVYREFDASAPDDDDDKENFRRNSKADDANGKLLSQRTSRRRRYVVRLFVRLFVRLLVCLLACLLACSRRRRSSPLTIALPRVMSVGRSVGRLHIIG